MPEKEQEERQRALRHIVSLALEEDLDAAGDITSRAIFGPDDRGAALVVAREAAVVSGMAAAAEVCLQVDPELIWLPLVGDGDVIPVGAQVARLEGRIISILTVERTLLNFLSRLSGVATITERYVNRTEGLPTRIAATRKTTPGLRLAEKQAVADAGGEMHRLGLYDAVLIKDNHIAAAGGVAAAVARVRAAYAGGVDIEVEVDDVGQLEEAIQAGVGRVLLDNMTPEQVAVCVKKAAGRMVVEASGGIGLDNVRDYAEAGVDIISVGALTRGAPGVDYSLEVEV